MTIASEKQLGLTIDEVVVIVVCGGLAVVLVAVSAYALAGASSGDLLPFRTVALVSLVLAICCCIAVWAMVKRISRRRATALPSPRGQ